MSVKHFSSEFGGSNPSSSTSLSHGVTVTGSVISGSSPIGPTRQTHASHGVKVQG